MKRSRPNAPGRLPWPSDRIVAVDLARFLALIGMFSEHLLAGHAPAWLLVAVTGFPSTAFAVLSGISAVISMRRYTADGRPLAACVSVAIRGFIVMVIGLVLGVVPLFLVMVLSYFGFALILAAAVLWMPTWALCTLAGIICATSPHLILWARAVSGDHGPIASPEWSSPAAFFTSILFTGFYPAYTWLGYILIGGCIGRILTRTSQQHRASIGILAVGLVMAAVGAVSDVLSRPAVLAVLQADGTPAVKARAMLTEQGDGTPLTSGVLAVVNGAPHSGTTADMLRTAGVALVVLALLLLATRKTSRLPLALRPLARAGSAPLTVYLCHFLGFYALLLLSVLINPEATWAGGPIGLTIHIAAAVLIGVYLAVTGKQGPVENRVSRITRWATGRLTHHPSQHRPTGQPSGARTAVLPDERGSAAVRVLSADHSAKGPIMTTNGITPHTTRRRRSSAAILLTIAAILGALSTAAWFTIGWFAPLALFSLATLCCVVGIVQLIRRH